MKRLRNLTTLLIMLALLTAGASERWAGASRALAAPPVQHPECNLVVSAVSGDVGALTVSGSGTGSLLITSPSNGMDSVTVGSATNANVSIAAFTQGSTSPVAVTATKVDPDQGASFSVTATDTVGHTITVSATVDCRTHVHDCTLTQGYWKTHGDDWPVSGLTLGTVSYTKAQLISILSTPVKGNGLVSLSHQLIAAKLNAAAGAAVPADVATAIAAADALIGGLVVAPIGSGYLSPSSTDALTSTLDAYNNGLAADGPPHCH